MNSKEFSLAIARVVLAMVILLGGFTALDLAIYLSVFGGTTGEKIAAAYDSGYNNGYAQIYGVTYQEAHGETYDKGYDKGYEIGLGTGSKEVTATRVELHNPTYGELSEFLAGDMTDSNLYIKDEYVSFNFSADLNNNAEANGIRAAYVRIGSREWGHTIVAFETTDKGLIFIEPQSDREVELIIGKPYPWEWDGAIRTSNDSDVVVEIQLLW
jgi:hypothetical protein